MPETTNELCGDRGGHLDSVELDPSLIVFTTEFVLDLVHKPPVPRAEWTVLRSYVVACSVLQGANDQGTGSVVKCTDCS